MAGCVRRIPWRSVAPILVLCGIVAAMLPIVRAARKAAWRAQRANNLKQIGLGLYNYCDTQHCLPPAVIRDSLGRPTMSWRFRVMPYAEAWTLYTYGCDKRWSDPNACALLLHPPFVFFDPAQGPPKSFWETSIVAVTGPGTAFDDDQCFSIADLAADTILAIEIEHSGTCWVEPRDLDISQVPDTITGGHDGEGVHVLFADGAVWFLNKKVPLEDLKKFFTVESAKRFRREDVLRPYAR